MPFPKNNPPEPIPAPGILCVSARRAGSRSGKNPELRETADRSGTAPNAAREGFNSADIRREIAAAR